MDCIGEICQFLSGVLVLQGVSDIDENDKRVLVSRLSRWERKYPGRMASIASERCLGLLKDEP
jgi:hypothetical protein